MKLKFWGHEIDVQRKELGFLLAAGTAFMYAAYSIKNEFSNKKNSASEPASTPPPAADVPQDEAVKPQTWADDFHKNYSMPKLPPFLAQIIQGCPKGYEDAMTMALLTELGALCFSKVRSVYLDRVMHSPSLLSIVEAPFGSGKSKFETLYKCLFERLIEIDNAKLSKGKTNEIIQNIGINTSLSMFYDVTASNQKVHMLILESEIGSVIDALKKQSGLSYEHLRKAFENGLVYQNTKVKDSATGMFPVYLNGVFAGTPDAVEKFIDKEIEGGTASRFIWTTIPENGREIATLNMPQGQDLDKIRDQIDEWHDKYCYHTDNGMDIASDETVIDLCYVNDALEKWLDNQYDLFEMDGNSARNDIRSRAATIAFHAAIIIHMLWGQPTKTEVEKRKAVTDLAIYVADYCIERFIHKFGAKHNLQREANRSAEYVKPEQQKESTVTIKGVPLDVARQMYEWYKPNVDGHGYPAIVKKWGEEYNLKYPNQVCRLFEELKTQGYVS
jgi:hypothetical protein